VAGEAHTADAATEGRVNPIWKAIARVLKRRRAVERLVAMRGMEGALKAIHGPPPTPEELQEAERLIAKQRARDHGQGEGLF
jgi:hypothetical protein